MNLIPRLWTASQELTSDPFRAMRFEMENALRALGQNSPSADIGAGAPAISVAETKDAYEVTAELPGVDEKDIRVSLDENQLVISGEKRRRARQKKRTGMSRRLILAAPSMSHPISLFRPVAWVSVGVIATVAWSGFLGYEFFRLVF